jgi:predicted phosphodiesterase
MSSLADLHSFQTMPWMYIDAAMQQYAVLSLGGDGISVDVVHFGHTHKKAVNNTAGYHIPPPFRVLGRVYE